jgi:hypothetical protein
MRLNQSWWKWEQVTYGLGSPMKNGTSQKSLVIDVAEWQDLIVQGGFLSLVPDNWEKVASYGLGVLVTHVLSKIGIEEADQKPPDAEGVEFDSIIERQVQVHLQRPRVRRRGCVYLVMTAS